MKIPQEIRERTINKFTNLYDGKVLPNISVSDILNYIEGQSVKMPSSNIKDKFQDELINELDEEDYWDEYFLNF